MPRKEITPPKMCQKCGVNPKPRTRGARYCSYCSVHCAEHTSQKAGCNACRMAVTNSVRHTEKYKEIQGRSYRRRKYNLTDEELDVLLAIDACQVCGSAERLVIDHDHATGKVRGVLCDDCNISLGKMKDSAANLRKLADYLDFSVPTSNKES